MEIYDFESIKAIGDNVVFSQNLLLCDDCRSLPSSSCLEKHSHSFYEIQYVFNGEGVGIYENSSFLLQSGSLLIIHPGEIHTYYSTENLSIVNICFKPNNTQIKILQTFKNNLLFLNEDSRLEFETLYYLLKNALKSNNKYSERKSETYFNAILNIVSCVSSQTQRFDDHWNNLLFCISENFSTITLENAAEICGHSVSSFCHIFKKKFGKTFLQYLDNIKLEKSIDLLISSDINIDDISYQVGFSHPSRFFRLFKQKMGVTPRRFREEKQK